MNAIAILKDLAARPLADATRLRPKLDSESLNVHPHHDNSIAWLLWHTAREIDEQLAHLSGQEPLWTDEGFAGRFGVGVAATDIGYGHSPAQARSVTVKDPGLLLEYLEAATHRQLAYLDSLEERRLDEIIDEAWDPPVTRGTRLVSISVDAVQHVAQAAYILGMGEAAFEQ